jgi:hypothetical protein
MKRTPRGEPPREETIRCECARDVRLRAVGFEGRGALATGAREFRHRGLHPVGHLVLRDARLDLGVELAFELMPIESADCVQFLASGARIDARRIRQIEHRVSTAAEGDALMA